MPCHVCYAETFLLSKMMLGRRRRFLLALSLLLATPFSAEQQSSAEVPAAVTPSRDADDTGRFLAGLPGAPASLFAQLEVSPAWKEHRRHLDEAWHKSETSMIRGLLDFQKQELDRAPTGDSTVFYPFGGPDALTATLCFPHSPAYVFVGLEPPGTLPSPEQLAKKDLSKYLPGVREAMAFLLGRSFFITHQMDQQFRGQVTDGLLLPILELLVRRQYAIGRIRLVRVDEAGHVIERAAGYKTPAKFANNGVEIEFRSDPERTTHKLYYFTVNLSDERLRENKPFLAYLSRMRDTTTLLKATSYVMHRPDFSIIRDLVLANSVAILQDDSGVPYRCFRPGIWSLLLYGAYDHPYGSFRGRAQPDLRNAYKATGPKPLSFGIGYGYARMPSNLLLAKRVSAAPITQTRTVSP